MQKETNHELEDDLRPEYNFTQMGQGIRGNMLSAIKQGQMWYYLLLKLLKRFPLANPLMSQFYRLIVV